MMLDMYRDFSRFQNVFQSVQHGDRGLEQREKSGLKWQEAMN